MRVEESAKDKEQKRKENTIVVDRNPPHERRKFISQGGKRHARNQILLAMNEMMKARHNQKDQEPHWKNGAKHPQPAGRYDFDASIFQYCQRKRCSGKKRAKPLEIIPEMFATQGGIFQFEDYSQMSISPDRKRPIQMDRLLARSAVSMNIWQRSAKS